MVCCCSVLTEAGILPHLASHVVYDDKKLDILTEVCWVLTYLTASYVFILLFFSSNILSSLELRYKTTEIMSGMVMVQSRKWGTCRLGNLGTWLRSAEYTIV